ncbi:MAG TPA: acetyl-CoA carboxylase carboxyl transferase subunit alpha [Elusimicrobia bacterium]|nr:MAG: acetyl-CoA carboxylase carboxyltransferase subunit alpha [Elusimicrobia bacterium RIFOXYA12_FULL_49_49]OGS16239.1 MAG: acetyl-CoA carboxylase carboxyltransferase subunit alpha [Elusimicrobia bacterium RIFOXYA2_FULL_47_53]OGS26218.1 MAG: acetyl-CoA carboxylase carboxyltransferase subunit alpha [Elusimicrobia bacterium RIFOXYB12_FULL_50_12]OGS31394.1 MAG: acetyl-CoA carboxylase carboxyltransferase subunit alpha [Elusimicrobia bacterium RIFOXYB2_FULL_46_23]HBU70069.1 acetyl-CoA carboxylase
MADKIAVLEFEKPIVEMQERITALKNQLSQGQLNLAPEIADLEKKYSKLQNEIYGSLTTWQRIQVARHPSRPYTMDYVRAIFTDFVELHGDRAFADDRALVCGLAFLDGAPVAVIGHQKGRSIDENMERNFGMAHPEGYRKAMRVMKLAEKFNRPVITFIDTTGAYPGIGAEERGQAEAIARNLRDMSDLKVPVISIVIGEGGSGGALGIGVANRILMLENAYYSVISPEGCAAILFRDAARAQEAAIALKVSAKDLQAAGVVDEIISEPLGGAHTDRELTAKNIKQAVLKHIDQLEKLSPQELSDDRYAKYRGIGVFEESLSSQKKSARKTKTKSGKTK